MKAKINWLLVGLTLGAEVLQLTTDLVPDHIKPYSLVGVALIPKITSILAQYANPDGTPAQQPWHPNTNAHQ